MWLRGKFDFPERWLPRKADLPGSRKPHVWYFADIWTFGHSYICKCQLAMEFCGHRDIWTLGHMDISLFVLCAFPVNLTSWEMWLPGKCDFSGNVTSRERWLPGNGDFLGTVNSWEELLPWKGDFLEKVTSREEWLLGKGDIPERVASREGWLPGKSHIWYFADFGTFGQSYVCKYQLAQRGA